MSPVVNEGYPTREALLEAEANGWVVIYVGRSHTSDEVITNVIGPHADQDQARRVAARVRAAYRRAVARDGRAPTEMVTVNVRPLWKEFSP